LLKRRKYQIPPHPHLLPNGEKEINPPQSPFFKGGSISPSLIKGRSGWIYKNALTLFFQGPGSHIQRIPLGVAQRASLRRQPGPFILFFLKIPPHPRLLPNGEKEINPPQSPFFKGGSISPSLIKGRM